MDVFKCYFKTIEKKYNEAIEYYYGTSENYSTIRGKYFNLINTYEPTLLLDHNILLDCFLRG